MAEPYAITRGNRDIDEEVTIIQITIIQKVERGVYVMVNHHIYY
jgi:hypothetical protein